MIRTHLRSLALVLAAPLALTACGGDGDAGEAGEAEDGSAATEEATAQDEATAQPEATGDEQEEASGESITVGIITTTSGFLGGYGNQYLEGLEAGLAYATDGSGAVNGRPVELEILDDGGEPEQAISAATDLIGRGINIIAGSASSGVAVQLAPFAEENGVLYISGPAATDAITGVNDHTFRSGRQTYQDVATAASLLENVSGDVLVFAQDSEFGAGNVAGVEAVLGGMGAEVGELLVPLNAAEFTPFAQQVIEAEPDLLFVAWAGDTTAAMWQALAQQGVFDTTTVTTGLGDTPSWSTYGENPDSIEFLSHYFPGAGDNEVHQFMVDQVAEPDLFTPDGFVAGQMIVQALSEGDPEDVASMITALEGWTFDAPKGTQTIRAEDHAMLQPMFTASLSGEAGAREAELLDTLEPDTVAPPLATGQ